MGKSHTDVIVQDHARSQAEALGIKRPRSQAGLLAVALGVHPKIFRQRLRRMLGSRRLALGHTRCKPWAFSEADLASIKALFKR